MQTVVKSQNEFAASATSHFMTLASSIFTDEHGKHDFGQCRRIIIEKYKRDEQLFSEISWLTVRENLPHMCPASHY